MFAVCGIHTYVHAYTYIRTCTCIYIRTLHTATHCQHAAACCNTLQHAATQNCPNILSRHQVVDLHHPKGYPRKKLIAPHFCFQIIKCILSELYKYTQKYVYTYMYIYIDIYIYIHMYMYWGYPQKKLIARRFCFQIVICIQSE